MPEPLMKSWGDDLYAMLVANGWMVRHPKANEDELIAHLDRWLEEHRAKFDPEN